MKLHHALSDYGLLPPRTIDVMNIDELPLDPLLRQQLVTHVFTRLVGHWLADGRLMPMVSETVGPLELWFDDGHAYHHLGLRGTSYSWLRTGEVRAECSWTCGIIEAAFRRWMNGFQRELGPHTWYDRRIPATLGHWPLASSLG